MKIRSLIFMLSALLLAVTTTLSAQDVNVEFIGCNIGNYVYDIQVFPGELNEDESLIVEILGPDTPTSYDTITLSDFENGVWVTRFESVWPFALDAHISYLSDPYQTIAFAHEISDFGCENTTSMLSQIVTAKMLNKYPFQCGNGKCIDFEFENLDGNFNATPYIVEITSPQVSNAVLDEIEIMVPSSDTPISVKTIQLGNLLPGVYLATFFHGNAEKFSQEIQVQEVICSPVVTQFDITGECGEAVTYGFVAQNPGCVLPQVYTFTGSARMNGDSTGETEWQFFEKVFNMNPESTVADDWTTISFGTGYDNIYRVLDNDGNIIGEEILACPPGPCNASVDLLRMNRQNNQDQCNTPSEFLVTFEIVNPAEEIGLCDAFLIEVIGGDGSVLVDTTLVVDDEGNAFSAFIQYISGDNVVTVTAPNGDITTDTLSIACPVFFDVSTVIAGTVPACGEFGNVEIDMGDEFFIPENGATFTLVDELSPHAVEVSDSMSFTIFIDALSCTESVEVIVKPEGPAGFEIVKNLNGCDFQSGSFGMATMQLPEMIGRTLGGNYEFKIIVRGEGVEVKHFDLSFGTFYDCNFAPDSPQELILNSNTTDLDEIGIYPNPAKELVMFSNLQGVLDIKIMNIRGVEMDSRRINELEEDCSLNVSNYPAGHYFAIFTNNSGEIISRKIQVLR